MLEIIQKIPVVTTLFSGVFAYMLFAHWQAKGRPRYIFWWMLGVICYGLGTLTESIVGLFGWSVVAFKAWYILGALMGGFPLAQGSVYLIFPERTANALTAVLVTIIVSAAILTLASPVHYEWVEPTRLTGKVLGWKFIRYMTPLINLYAFFFLVGGAAWSAYRYSRDKAYVNRFRGNLFIAIGGLLPGIGGSFTKFGFVEVLYVTELIGILFIYCGYRTIRKDKTLSVFVAQQR